MAPLTPPTVPMVEIMLDRPRHLRFTFNEMVRFEQHTGKRLLQQDTLSALSATDFRSLIWACLAHEDDALTPEFVGEHLHMGNFPEITDKLSQIWNASTPDESEKRPTRAGGARSPGTT